MSMAWAALLVTLVAAGEVDKEACSPSLLQIHSSIHEAGHNRPGGCTRSRTEILAQRSQSQLTLLQVAARTGEVAAYQPKDNEEEAPVPVSKKAASDKKEKHHAIDSLLVKGSIAAPDDEEKQSYSKSGKSKSDDEEPNDEDEQSQSKSGKSKSDEAQEEKPKRRIVIDEADDSNIHIDVDSKAEKDSNNDDKAEHESADLDRPVEKQDVEDVPQGARIAPFGKEDTARELQHHAARTQDTLVDAIENAEVAEIKRSIFRSLTRLRAAEIKEFDTIARLETQAIDEYNDNHHYRKENPLDYIHAAEDGVKKDKYTSFHD